MPDAIYVNLCDLFNQGNERRFIRAFLISAAPPAFFVEQDMVDLYVSNVPGVPLQTQRVVSAIPERLNIFRFACLFTAEGTTWPKTAAGLRLVYNGRSSGGSNLHLGFAMFDQPKVLTASEPNLQTSFLVSVARRR